jgi:hypothetical protein
MKRRHIDIAGQRFGRLVVIRRTGTKRTSAVWLCHCDCGTNRHISGAALRSGNTQSCGCLHREAVIESNRRKRRHGMAGTGTYRAWQDMKTRCTNSRRKCWNDYGGRGISICARWSNSFENFLADMGERPPGLTLDRINNDDGYKPSNCRWATRLDQTHNRRPNPRKPSGRPRKVRL